MLDIGSHSTRAGYAGEDVPKCVIPTAHGYIDSDAPEGKVRKYFVGEEGANSWRDGMEVGSIMRDGLGQYNLPDELAQVRWQLVKSWGGFKGGWMGARRVEGDEAAGRGKEKDVELTNRAQPASSPLLPLLPLLR